MALLMPEDLGRYGWDVEIDEAADTVKVTCPRCHRPAFDAKGALDDVAHVFHHYIGEGNRAHKALSALSSAVECFTTHDIPRGDIVIVLRFLGAALVDVAPVASDELMDAK